MKNDCRGMLVIAILSGVFLLSELPANAQQQTNVTGNIEAVALFKNGLVVISRFQAREVIGWKMFPKSFTERFLSKATFRSKLP
ncbi:MAG: hypothetical protein LBT05_11640 [Planctomycetaceae bacterium]|jgi:hypothetical protein|nr:hypothetical protein [Planctomycetaceae bacterium]